MIEQILTLQWGGFYGGGFGNFLSQLEQMGFFSYILPFLLIFAIVFGILTKVNLFKNNKAVNAIIALVIGLLALQFNFVPMFFSEIFPRLGIGLAIILALLILVGLFAPTKSDAWTHWIFFGAAFVVFIVVLVQTFGWLGWSNTYLWSYNWAPIIMVAVVLGFIIWVISQNPRQQPKRVNLTFPGPPAWQDNS